MSELLALLLLIAIGGVVFLVFKLSAQRKETGGVLFLVES